VLLVYFDHLSKAYSPVFTEQQLASFLQHAPNDGDFLLQKLSLLFALYGGLRTIELNELRRSRFIISVFDIDNNHIHFSPNLSCYALFPLLTTSS
jgi:hypothetical protein